VLARSNPPPPPSPETATDLADLERLVDAKKPPKVVVEELSSAHLEVEDDEELALDAGDILESGDPDTRIEMDAYVPAEARPTPIPEPAPVVAPEPAPAPVVAEASPVDLSETVQGVPAPAIPEAPKTSPVPVALAAAAPSPTEDDAEERVNFTQPFRRPSSIAPVAIDLGPQLPIQIPPQAMLRPAPAMRPAPVRVDATVPLPRMSARQAETVITRIPPPKTNIVPWVIAASIVGLFLAGGGVVAAMVTSSSDAPHAVAAVDAPKVSPRTADVTSAKTALTDNAESAPTIGAHGDKVGAPAFSSSEPVSVDALPTAAASPAAAPAPRPAHTASAPAASPTSKTLVAAPAPAPSPAAPPAAPPAAAPSPPRPAATTGVVHVPPPLVVVVVDGQHRRVVNGDVVVGCGTHKIRAGMSEQIVNVPCGGAISL
jgi:hypothetical protein